MNVTLEIPDAIARQMHLDGPQAQRQALIGVVVEGFRQGTLSRGQVSELLNLSFWETADLLKEHGCGIGSNQTFEEFERESELARAYLKR